MRILCKEKDYYDHIGFSSGYGSEDVIFDRRDFTVYEKDENHVPNRWLDHPRYDECSIAREALNRGYGSYEPNAILAIVVGFNVYAFKIFNKDIDHGKYSIEFIGMRKCYELNLGSPLKMFKLETRPFGKLTTHKEWAERWKLERKDKKRDFETDAFLNGNPANWEFKPLFTNRWSKDIDKSFPILKNTSFPKYMDAKEVYYAIEDWLIAQHNDVDQESKGLTDIDKVENHGFDKKISFRSVK